MSGTTQKILAGLGAVALFVILPLTVVWAADIGNTRSVDTVRAIGYAENTNTAVYRTGLLGSDEADLANGLTLGLDKVNCKGYDTVNVHGRFTNASATCIVSVVLYNAADEVIKVQEFTLTAKARTILNSLFFSNPTPVDTEGAVYSRIIIQAPSAGTIDLWAGVS